MRKKPDFLFKKTKPHLCPQTDPSKQLLSKRMGPQVPVSRVPRAERLPGRNVGGCGLGCWGRGAWMLCDLTLGGTDSPARAHCSQKLPAVPQGGSTH